MSTDTLVILIAVVFFGAIAVGCVVSYRSFRKNDYPLIQKGINPDNVRFGPFLVEKHMQFFTDHFYMPAVDYDSFRPCRPGRRPFSAGRVRAFTFLILLTQIGAYALGEWLDSFYYRTLPFINQYQTSDGASYDYLDLYVYENKMDGMFGWCIVGIVIGIVALGAFLNDKHGQWLKAPALMVLLEFFSCDIFFFASSFIPIRGREDNYSVFHVGYRDTEVLGQLFWVPILVLTFLLLFVLPLIRRAFIANYPSYADERLHGTFGFNFAMVLIFSAVGVCVTYAVGIRNPVTYVVCVLHAAFGYFLMYDICNLEEWAENVHADGIDEWPAAFSGVIAIEIAAIEAILGGIPWAIRAFRSRDRSGV